MATQQSSGPPRIPLVASIDSRLETPSDGRVINGYIENSPEGEVIVKRPAISTYITLSGGGTGGCYYWNGSLYAIANWTLYKDGIAVSGVGNIGGGYSFASILGSVPKLVFHNLQNLYIWDGSSITFSSAGGNSFLQGFAYLDGTLYGVASPANIFGSGLNDPTTWNPLNVIVAQQEPDFAVAIMKQLQYVIVFKNWTIEAFWDAANPVGSPLQPAPGTLLQFGCRQPGSIQQFEDVILWASATRNGSVGVMMMENLRTQTVSTPAIERLLQDADWTTIYSWCGRISGHRFYCLTLVNSNISLVYDLTTQRWFQWTYGTNQQYLPFMFVTSLPDRRIVLQHENGSLYTFSQVTFLDDGQDIPVDIYTPNWDGGTRKRKVLQRLEVIGDQAGMREATLRWSEDDYQTWTQGRPVDLGARRPFIDNLGTFYRRAFHLRYNAPTSFRIKALECTGIKMGA